MTSVGKGDFRQGILKWFLFVGHVSDLYIRLFQSERHFIMQVVCEATQSSFSQVRVAALQCLVKIMSLYYQYMEHYMGPALFAVSRPSFICFQHS